MLNVRELDVQPSGPAAAVAEVHLAERFGRQGAQLPLVRRGVPPGGLDGLPPFVGEPGAAVGAHEPADRGRKEFVDDAQDQLASHLLIDVLAARSRAASPLRGLAHGSRRSLSGIAADGSWCLFMRLRGWRRNQLLDALGEALSGEGKFGFGFAEVACGDCPRDVGHELEDCGRS